MQISDDESQSDKEGTQQQFNIMISRLMFLFILSGDSLYITLIKAG